LKKKNNVGDLILPIAAIRGEGTSNDYLPAEVPALPAFALQKAISTTIRDFGRDYWTGTCYTTNRRVWEHDKDFKKYLKDLRAMAIDMETATIFTTGFANKIPTGRFAAGIRSADDTRRCKNRRKRLNRNRAICRNPPAG
jgi:AMP nucleosidase